MILMGRILPDRHRQFLPVVGRWSLTNACRCERYVPGRLAVGIGNSRGLGYCMYETHFGFHRPPFQVCDGRDGFYESQSVRGILPQLRHALRSDLGIAVLTGPSGCGKTTLLRHLRHAMLLEGRVVVCSAAALESPAELHAALGFAAAQQAGAMTEIEGRVSLNGLSRWQVVERLGKSRELWGPVVLLVDDAHLLSLLVVNELRAYTEESTGKDAFVRCLLCGPLSLEEELARPSHADISGRIRCHVFLQTLTFQESIGYLQQKLQSAGVRPETIIHQQALENLVVAAAGIPRCLNLLADECLVVAAESGALLVDPGHVNLALRRLQHLPYEWNLPSGGLDDLPHDEKIPSDESASEQTRCEVVSQGVIEFGAPQEVLAGSTGSALARTAESDFAEADIADSSITSASDDALFQELRFEFVEDELFEAESRRTEDDHSIPQSPPDRPRSPSRFNAPHAFEFDSKNSVAEFALNNDDIRSSPPDDGAATAVSRGTSAIDAPEAAIPVFDRYTWIELRRDISPDDCLLCSDTVSLFDDEQWLFEESYVADHRQQSIAVTMTSDHEIMASLFQQSPAVDARNYYLFRRADSMLDGDGLELAVSDAEELVALLQAEDAEDAVTIPFRGGPSDEDVGMLRDALSDLVDETDMLRTLPETTEDKGRRRFDRLFTKLQEVRKNRES